MNKILLVALVAVLGGVLAGCNPEKDNMPFSVRVVSVGTNSVDLEVVTNGINVYEVAYIIDTELGESYSAPVIFATAADARTKDRRFRIEDLEADVDYYIHFAAKRSATTTPADYYMLKVTTKDYSQYDQMLTLWETDYYGYKLRITTPDIVKNNPEKYAVRYTYTCLPMYLMQKITKGTPDYEMLTTNAGMHTTRSKTIDFNENNEILYDEYGEVVYDEEGETVWIHDPIVPGEPSVFLAAPFQWVEKDDPLCPYGWNSGYHLHTFDDVAWAENKATVTPSITEGMEWVNDEDAFWKHGFQRLFFTVRQPEEFTEDFDELVSLENMVITPINFEVDVIPEDDKGQYCYCLIDQATYNAVLPWLDNNEDYMQWFVTSWLAVYELGAKTAQGPLRIKTSDLYYDGLEAETTYHLLIVYLGKERGKQQKYLDYEFKTVAKTKPAPEIVVTPKKVPIEAAYDKEVNALYAFSAHYNIKAPNKDVVSASYAANYVKDWVAKLNSDNATYADVLASGTAFGTGDIEKINSDEGLDIVIPTVDGQTTRLVVSGRNDENTNNNLKVKNPAESSAIADYVAPDVILSPRVNSPLFEQLEGKWTAEATICYSEYVKDENDEQVLTKTLHQWKTNVEITPEFEEGVDYPSVLDQKVYDAYKTSLGEKYSEAYVNELYADFKKQAEHYNKVRLYHSNRLLVKGIVDYDSYDRLEWLSPYELFYHDKYSSYDNAQIFYDFGPKWYLQVAEDGTVTVPFSYERMEPVVNWQDAPYYLCAMWYDKDNTDNSTDAFIESADKTGFPVEISDNGNKITIKPIPNTTDPSKPLYMNVVAIQNGSPSMYAPFMSELVLTRGWTDDETTVEDITANKPESVNVVDSKGMPVSPKTVVCKSMTELNVREPLKVQEIEVITLDSMREKLLKSSDRLVNRRAY